MTESENHRKGLSVSRTAANRAHQDSVVKQPLETTQDKMLHDREDSLVAGADGLSESNESGDSNSTSNSSINVHQSTAQVSQLTAKRRMLEDELDRLCKRHKHANHAAQATIVPMIRDLEAQLLENQVLDRQSNKIKLADWSWASLVIALEDGSQDLTEIAQQAQKELAWLTSYMWPSVDTEVVNEATPLLRQMCFADEPGFEASLASATAKYHAFIEIHAPTSKHKQPLMKLLKDHPRLPLLVQKVQRRYVSTSDDQLLQEALMVSFALDLDCPVSG